MLLLLSQTVGGKRMEGGPSLTTLWMPNKELEISLWRCPFCFGESQKILPLTQKCMREYDHMHTYIHTHIG